MEIISETFPTQEELAKPLDSPHAEYQMHFTVREGKAASLTGWIRLVFDEQFAVYGLRVVTETIAMGHDKRRKLGEIAKKHFRKEMEDRLTKADWTPIPSTGYWLPPFEIPWDMGPTPLEATLATLTRYLSMYTSVQDIIPAGLFPESAIGGEAVSFRGPDGSLFRLNLELYSPPFPKPDRKQS